MVCDDEIKERSRRRSRRSRSRRRSSDKTGGAGAYLESPVHDLSAPGDLRVADRAVSTLSLTDTR
jgi:hypothetical protein